MDVRFGAREPEPLHLVERAELVLRTPHRQRLDELVNEIGHGRRDLRLRGGLGARVGGRGPRLQDLEAPLLEGALRHAVLEAV